MTGHRKPMELPDLGGSGPCRDVDPELFFPDESLEEARAKELMSLCDGCPVAERCLEYALSRAEAGIWAGTTTAQRKKIRRRARLNNPQQQRTAATRAQVHALAAKGLTSRQIIDQTGLHERTVSRAMRSFRGQPERSAA